MTDGINAEC